MDGIKDEWFDIKDLPHFSSAAPIRYCPCNKTGILIHIRQKAQDAVEKTLMV
jgi:hypothetical protein